MTILVLNASFTLGVNRLNYWNDRFNYIFGNQFFKYVIEDKVLNETFRKSPSEKFFEGNEIFGPQFLCFNCVQTSLGVPFCYRVELRTD